MPARSKYEGAISAIDRDFIAGEAGVSPRTLRKALSGEATRMQPATVRRIRVALAGRGLARLLAVPPLEGLFAGEQTPSSVLHAVAALDPRDRDIVTARFLRGLRLRTIARTFGVSHQRIGQILRRALAEIRSQLRDAT